MVRNQCIQSERVPPTPVFKRLMPGRMAMITDVVPGILFRNQIRPSPTRCPLGAHPRPGQPNEPMMAQQADILRRCRMPVALDC